MKKDVTIKVNLQQIILNGKSAELKELINKLKKLDVWVDEHIEYDDQKSRSSKENHGGFHLFNII